MHTLVSAVSGACAVVVAKVFRDTWRRRLSEEAVVRPSEQVEHDRQRAVASTIRTLAAVVWPVVLLSAIPPEDRTNKYVCIPIVWNTGMWMLDSMMVHHYRSKGGKDKDGKDKDGKDKDGKDKFVSSPLSSSSSSSSGPPTARASVRFEPSMLLSLSFGLSNLVGSRPGSRYNYLFMYAMLGMMLVVLPSHNIDNDYIEDAIIESVQKAALMWCMGLIVAGVVLTSGLKVDDKGSKGGD